MNLYEQIAAVKLDRVPVMSHERCIPRKEQAKLARQLFAKLGIKGVSVTAPNYSMAQSVDVRVPAEAADMTGFEQYEHSTYSDMPDYVPVKAAMLRKNQAQKHLFLILNHAFPCHDDRSDSQSDYFDYCWSMN